MQSALEWQQNQCTRRASAEHLSSCGTTQLGEPPRLAAGSEPKCYKAAGEQQPNSWATRAVGKAPTRPNAGATKAPAAPSKKATASGKAKVKPDEKLLFKKQTSVRCTRMAAGEHVVHVHVHVHVHHTSTSTSTSMPTVHAHMPSHHPIICVSGVPVQYCAQAVRWCAAAMASKAIVPAACHHYELLSLAQVVCVTMWNRAARAFARQVAQEAKAVKKALANEQNRHFIKVGLENGVTMIKREGKWVVKDEVSRWAVRIRHTHLCGGLRGTIAN